MSKTLVPERGGRKRTTTHTLQQPKLARGTRDIPATTIKVARGTRELPPLFPQDPDDDTVVVDPDPALSDDLCLDSDAGYSNDVGDASDPGEVTEVSESQAGDHA